MNDQTKIATAVVAGYLLGRTKQGKRALRIALWLGGGSSGVMSTLGQQGLSRLEGNPAIGALLTQIRGPLMEAGRKALTSTLENKANSLADNLHSRTEALGLPGGSGVHDIIDADDQGEDEDEDQEEAPRQRRSRSEPARRRTRQADADADEKPRRQQRTSRAKRDEGTTSTKKSTGKSSTRKAPAAKTAGASKTAPAAKTTSKREPAKRTTTRSTSRSTSRSGSGSQSGTTRRRGSAR